MKRFSTLYAAALRRKGGEEGLRALLPEVKTSAQLRKLKDDRVLSAMAKAVMRSGFYGKVVEAKWPDMEKVLFRFDPRVCARLSDLELGELTDDERVIRHRKKLEAIRDNARYVNAIAGERGSYGAHLAAWPDDDIVGLWLELKKKGARLGGQTGPRFLRSVGKDTFLLTRDTLRVLRDCGVLDGDGDKEPTSQRELRLAERAFLRWRDETGLPLAHLSRIASCSVAS